MSDQDARQQGEQQEDEGSELSESNGVLPGDDDEHTSDGANEYETTDLDDD